MRFTAAPAARSFVIGILAVDFLAGLAARPAMAEGDLASGLDLSSAWRQVAAFELAAADTAADASQSNALPVADEVETKTGSRYRLLPVLLGLRESNDWTQPFVDGIDRQYDSYLAFKKSISDQYNFDFFVDFSFYSQFGSSGHPVWVAVYYPGFSWRPFTDTPIGSGKIDFTTGFQNYFGHNNSQQAAELGLISLANDWTSDNFTWSTLTYTHTLPGSMNWLSFAAGSYNLSSFDPSLYAANAQTTFISFSFSQDATQTFPNAGVGGFVKAKPNEQFSFAGGVQDGTNLRGNGLPTYGYQTDRLLGWGNVQWTPNLPGYGNGVYSLLIYDQPFVPALTSQSTGVSLSASQELGDKWGAWARVNNATGSQIPIRTSYDAGGVIKDPFVRNPNDQIGVGLGWNKTNFENTGGGVRGGEWVSELYYRYQIVKAMSLTPDVQVFWNPAFLPSSGPVAVFTVRTTLSF
jgi:Carbohydrate-selective porin, OprB family